MSEEHTEKPRRRTLPRSVGTSRPVADVKPGWWLHLEAVPDTDGFDGWEQVSWIADTTRGNRMIVFAGDVEEGGGNMVTAHKSDPAVTLTAREAKSLGLVPAESVGG
jgi:hypothetical protein